MKEIPVLVILCKQKSYNFKYDPMKIEKLRGIGNEDSRGCIGLPES